MAESRTYRTIVAKPDAVFWGSTDREVLAEFVDKCREVCFARVKGDSVILDFEADDLYDLARTVFDLENELNSTPFHTGGLIIDRPQPVRSRTRQAAKPVPVLDGVSA